MPSFEIPSIEDEFKIAAEHFKKLLNNPGVKDLKTAQDSMYLPDEGNIPWFARYKDFYEQDEIIKQFQQNFTSYRDEIIHTYFHFQYKPHTPIGESHVEFLEYSIKLGITGHKLEQVAKIMDSRNEENIYLSLEQGRFFSTNVTSDHLKDYVLKLDVNKPLHAAENKSGFDLLASTAYVGNKLFYSLDKKFLWEASIGELEDISKQKIAVSSTQHNLTNVLSYNNTSGYKPITSEIPKAEIKLVSATCAYLNALNAGKEAFFKM